MQPEARELRRVDILHEMLVLGGCDAAVQYPPGRGGVVARVELGARELRRALDIDQICRYAGSRRASVDTVRTAGTPDTRGIVL